MGTALRRGRAPLRGVFTPERRPFRIAMEISVNGERKPLPRPITVREFLTALQLPTLDGGIAVLLNGEVVRKGDWEQKVLQAEDKLEIVHATRGG